MRSLSASCLRGVVRLDTPPNARRVYVLMQTNVGTRNRSWTKSITHRFWIPPLVEKREANVGKRHTSTWDQDGSIPTRISWELLRAVGEDCVRKGLRDKLHRLATGAIKLRCPRPLLSGPAHPALSTFSLRTERKVPRKITRQKNRELKLGEARKLCRKLGRSLTTDVGANWFTSECQRPVALTGCPTLFSVGA